MPPPRIALVDDEASVRIALGRVLRVSDYKVLAYASGEEFLAAIGADMPDCALLDIHLPGLSGIEVQMRLQASHPQLPVVFITASDDPTIELSAERAGGLRVLRKPVSRQALLDSIVSALQAASQRPR
jgi:FixJ family two-component response regulator